MGTPMPSSALWWLDFENRVDATGVPADENPFKNLTAEASPGLCWLLGDPENRAPVAMDVHTADGWLTYKFEVVDLEAISWNELPNLIADEGPTTFREVVALAKSKYERRCGYLTPTIHRMPIVFIDDLLVGPLEISQPPAVP